MIFSPIKRKNSLHSAYNNIRNVLNRNLTLTEKMLFSHMKEIIDTNGRMPTKNESYIEIYPDRVIMQDATAQMALLQFINSKKTKTHVPTSIHCDHLIVAEKDYAADLSKANKDNGEVYAFLKSACKKYNIHFWEPGSGIIHQVVLENYASPGMFLIGTDSHTPNAGGIGAFAVGIGGTDAVDVMTGEPLILKLPNIMGVHLDGQLSNWASAKDVILTLLNKLTVKGGTGFVLEFFGPGTQHLTTTSKATITNMGAELGATTSIFPADSHATDYLQSTNRAQIGDFVKDNLDLFMPDKEVIQNPSKFYDKIIEINLNELTPCIAGPGTPDIVNTSDTIEDYLNKNHYPIDISMALIGSCTNSSYEDIKKILFLAQFAIDNDLLCKVPVYISPGSNAIAKLLYQNVHFLNKMNVKILSNSCGPCIGQWKRTDVKEEYNSILTSYNRNFPARNDGNKNTYSFISSPEMVLAVALAGKLNFNPLQDYIKNKNGINIKLPQSLPSINIKNNHNLFTLDNDIVEHSPDVPLLIKKSSKRLEFLKKFPAPSQEKFNDVVILLKAKGKCTTDHISPAGKWLKYRGHLTNISQNTYLGAFNFFTQKIGVGFDLFDNNNMKPFYNIAVSYSENNRTWSVIGDENFGEGSSREHAALQPRYLGCVAIIVKSFARIHETNLKKHGILPLTFIEKDDYNIINYDDTILISNTLQIQEGKSVTVTINNKTSQKCFNINCKHSYSKNQISWFIAGSALNYISNKDLY